MQIPVPLFFPTTLDSAERIVKTIQEIKEKIPDDPLEADLIMMAEMVAEDAEKENSIIVTGKLGTLGRCLIFLQLLIFLANTLINLIN